MKYNQSIQTNESINLFHVVGVRIFFNWLRYLFLYLFSVFFAVFINNKHNPNLRHPFEYLLTTLRVSVNLILCYNFTSFRIDKSDCEVYEFYFGEDTRMGKV